MNGNEFEFVFSGSVEWEPVVEVAGAESPVLPCPNSIFESHFLNVCEHDGFGGGEWEIVLEDSQVTVSNLDSVVFVEYLGHGGISN